jgi:hypothetical protein
VPSEFYDLYLFHAVPYAKAFRGEAVAEALAQAQAVDVQAAPVAIVRLPRRAACVLALSVLLVALAIAAALRRRWPRRSPPPLPLGREHGGARAPRNAGSYASWARMPGQRAGGESGSRAAADDGAARAGVGASEAREGVPVGSYGFGAHGRRQPAHASDGRVALSML